MAARLVVRESGCVVSLAYVNHSTRQIGACEFCDDDQFCAFEAAVVQIVPRECALPKEAVTPESRRFRDVLDRCGVLTPPRDVLDRCGALAQETKASEFNPKDLSDHLKRLVKGGNVEHYREVLEREGAAGAVAALINFAELLSDQANHNKYSLVGLHAA
eukprot:542399-Prorocentrum_minimum.AAC.1